MSAPSFDANDVARRYLAAWNERDDQRRAALVSGLWTDDGSFTDPMLQARGANEISSAIGAVHQRFPGHRFHLHGTPEGHHDRVRFSWSLAADGEEPIARGTEFAVMDGDRLGVVTGFFDYLAAA